MRFLRDRPKVATPAARRNAPKLHRNLTDPEKRLWMLLRKRLPQDGTHFRRQVALGPYVVDFVCFGARLIIELDGDQHGTDAALRYDAARTEWLETQGFQVLRFTNRQIRTEADMVLDTIFAALSGRAKPCPTPPTPGRSPSGGEASGDASHG
jgi:very-short-patch-repair endonuclease